MCGHRAVDGHLASDEGGDDYGEHVAIAHPKVCAIGGRGRGGHAVDLAHQRERAVVDGRSEVDVGFEAVPQLGSQLIGAAEGLQPASMQHGHAVGEPSGFTEEVRAHDDRSSVFGGERTDELDDVASGGGIEPGRRLVEEEHLGIVQQRAGQRETLALSRREALHLIVGAVHHPEPAEQLIDSLVGVRPPETAYARREQQVLASREAFVESGVLGEHTRCAGESRRRPWWDRARARALHRDQG